MNKLLCIGLAVSGAILLLGFIGYRSWIHNPHSESLHFDPATVFGRETATDGLLIRNVTLLDVESGTAVPDAHVVIKDGIIDSVMIGPPPSAADLDVLDGRGKYLMPGLVDAHVRTLPACTRRGCR